MRRNWPLDYDISVTADKRRRAARRAMSGAVDSSTRQCDHPGCERKGNYRAPRAPEELNRFYWFCLEHVREYNRGWNFFRDFSTEELEAQLESDRLWGRRTRRFGKGGIGFDPADPHADGLAWRRLGMEDPLDFMGVETPRRPRRALPASERRALDILGATDCQTRAEIRVLYKTLVKQLHPDLNGGHRGDEDRLREVLWAWEQIRGSRSFRD
ncbi:MAG: molecular chaperone DnaJ [Alphaproteobacteria bacterium]|nr:MAG: molecular chaperone DnaJ [Alphaproteobacteria bacterium]